jgi:hypothetical protein
MTALTRRARHSTHGGWARRVSAVKNDDASAAFAHPTAPGYGGGGAPCGTPFFRISRMFILMPLGRIMSPGF